MTASQIWRPLQGKGYSDEKYKQLLIDNGIIVNKGSRDQQLADRWIKMLQEWGYTPDQMVKVFRFSSREVFSDEHGKA